MRARLFAGLAVAGLTLGLARPATTASEPIDPLRLSTICSNESDASGGSAPASETPPKLLPGFGNGGFAITTANPEAQRWFSYGVALAQAFAHDPAKAAFREAARRDPDCAMCVWGQAWAAGPTINYSVSAAQRADALVLAIKAQALATASGSDRERRLAAAMVRRYARSGGDAAFAAEMTAVAATWPDDDALQVIAADAVLISGKTGQAKQAVALLERVLARNPDHTGAIHFYIHATEWIDQAGRAERFADRLAILAPGASHLIHMPSHTYYRVGRYREAGRANLSAIAVDKAWMQTVGGFDSGWKVPYFAHNVRFALGGAMMAGDAEAALTIAALFDGLPPEMARERPWLEDSAGSAWYARGRFADPDAVLAMAAPAGDRPLLRAMWRYGRGEALARKGDARGVRAEAAAMALTPAERASHGGGGRYAVAVAEIARQTLLGRAAMIEGRYAAAARAYRKAAAVQEKVLGEGGDPPTWWYPARRSLAAALLAGGRPDQALAEARAVLAKWPRDPMSLLVVARAEAALGHAVQAAQVLDQARSGWAGGPLEPIRLGEI